MEWLEWRTHQLEFLIVYGETTTEVRTSDIFWSKRPHFSSDLVLIEVLFFFSLSSPFQIIHSTLIRRNLHLSIKTSYFPPISCQSYQRKRYFHLFFQHFQQWPLFIVVVEPQNHLSYTYTVVQQILNINTKLEYLYWGLESPIWSFLVISFRRYIS